MAINERRFRQILREEAHRVIREDSRVNEGLFDFFTGGETGADWIKGAKSVVSDAKTQHGRLSAASGDENMSRRSWRDPKMKFFGDKLKLLEGFVKFIETNPPRGWFQEPIKKTLGNAIEAYRRSNNLNIDPNLRTKSGIDQLVSEINELSKDVAARDDAALRKGAFWQLTDRERRASDMGNADDTSRRLRAGADLAGELASAISRAGGEADNPEAAQMLKARRRGDRGVTDDDMRAMIKRLSSRYGSTMMGRIGRFFGGGESEPFRAAGREDTDAPRY